MNDRAQSWRFALCIALLAVPMAGLGSRLAFLHLGVSDEVRTRVERAREVEKTIIAGRGTIYDCRGQRNILALNLAVKDVCVDPKVIMEQNRMSDVVEPLADLLGMNADEVAVRMNRPDRRFAYVQRFVKEDSAAAIRDRNLPGVFFQDATIRYYPQNTFMCHVLGFVNHNGEGSAGVEQRFHAYLKGSPGLLEGQVDAFRQELYAQRDRYIPALQGANVELTLDQNIQYMVEKALDEAMVEHHAKGAWSIVQRVRTGEILAMAVRPAFNPNEFHLTPEANRLNRAIGYVYEPGSTFKISVIAAALNEGLVEPTTVFDCENGAWLYHRRILHDYHPYGRLTVADGLQKSSNIMAAKVALLLGDARLHAYLTAFGFGRPLGIDLPGEEAGILNPLRSWSGISATRVAIGQGVAVTGLQMLGAMCAIANDGFLMRPYVVKQVTAADGSVLMRGHPEVLSRPIRADTSELMRRLLARVTETGGTGTRAQVDGYRVAGKTGSAQKPINGSYSMSAHMASFVGFLPAADPEIAVIVVVDEPEPLHTGGVVAAPIFKRIAAEAVCYLNVPPVDWPSETGSLAHLP